MSSSRKRLKLESAPVTQVSYFDSLLKCIALFLKYQNQLSVTPKADLTQISRSTALIDPRPVSSASVDLRRERATKRKLERNDLQFISDLLELDDPRLCLDEIAELLEQERGVVVSISTLCRELQVFFAVNCDWMRLISIHDFSIEAYARSKVWAK
jgi:hypothetical protein